MEHRYRATQDHHNGAHKLHFKCLIQSPMAPYLPLPEVGQGNSGSSREQDVAIRLWDADTGRLKSTLMGATHGVRAVAFSPDGTILAAGIRDSNIQLWDVTTRKLVVTLRSNSHPVNSVTFSPDGKILASAGGHGDWQTEGMVELWDVGTRELIATLTGDRSSANSVAFSPDGRDARKVDMGIGTRKPTVQLWNVATRELITTFMGAYGGGQ